MYLDDANQRRYFGCLGTSKQMFYAFIKTKDGTKSSNWMLFTCSVASETSIDSLSVTDYFKN